MSFPPVSASLELMRWVPAVVDPSNPPVLPGEVPV